MNEDNLHSWIDPELEARIVALVLGEASDFEREELERLMREQPELAVFKNRIEAVHDLLRDEATAEGRQIEDEWKLPAERRGQLLATIEGDPQERAANVVGATIGAEPPAAVVKRTGARLARIAAVLCVLGIAVAALTLPVYRAQEARRAPAIALLSDLDRVEATESLERFRGRNPAPPAEAAGAADVWAVTAGESVAGQSARASGRGYRSIDELGAVENGAAGVAATSASGPEPDSAGARGAIVALQETLDIPSQAEAKLDAVPEPEIAAGLAWQGANFAYIAPESNTRADAESYGQTPAANGLPMPQLAVTAPVITWNEGASADDLEMRSKSLSQVAPLTFGGDAIRDSQRQTSERAHEVIALDDLSSGVKVELEGKAKARMMADATTTGSSGGGSPQSPLTEPSTDARGLFESTGRVAVIPENAPAPGILVAPPSRKPAPAPAPAPASGEALAEDSAPLDVKLQVAADKDIEELGAIIVAKDAQANTAGSTAVSGGIIETDGYALNQPMPTSEPAVDAAAAENRLAGADFETAEGEFQQWPSQPGATMNFKERVTDFATAESAGREVTADRESELGTVAEEEPLRKETSALNLNFTGGRPFSITREKKQIDDLRAAPPAGLDEKSTVVEAFSTFSLHVSDVSFKLAQAALARGEWPDAGTIRIEEFVNAFDYGDPTPGQREKIACYLEQATHPFLQQRNLLRVSMRTAAAGRSGDTPLRLTILLDNSGSMERVDRRETVRRAFAQLADLLQSTDQVTLISFARQPRLLADQVTGDRSRELALMVADIPSEGGTNLEAALQLAFEKAREHHLENAQNRIVLFTDGAANLGDAKPENLARMIESMREAGIAFDAAGIGADGLNDEILEALTRKGDGRYYLLDRPEDADAGFARLIAGALRPAAMNVKVQVEFNPRRVARYKLLGFEKHLLNEEDFRNDKVDAAELAAEEAGVAIYQFQPLPEGEGDAGSVSVRFRDLSTGQMIEQRWPIPYEPAAPRLDQAPPSLRIAAVAALLAANLKGDPVGETADLSELARIVSALPERYQRMERVRELREMIDQARELK